MLRGSSDDEPSPVNSACRNARLNAAEPRQTRSGTCFARLAWPMRQPSSQARKPRQILDVQLAQPAA